MHLIKSRYVDICWDNFLGMQTLNISLSKKNFWIYISFKSLIGEVFTIWVRKNINGIIKIGQSINTFIFLVERMRWTDFSIQSQKLFNVTHQSESASIEINYLSHHINQHFRITFHMKMSDSLLPSHIYSQVHVSYQEHYTFQYF
jgi:hypothetical protein